MDPDLVARLTARLQKLESLIQLEKITVSFSLEDRDAAGRKRSAFYSVTSSRRHVEAQFPSDAPVIGWTMREAQVVGCVLSKHVVAATYRDAVRRGIMSSKAANEEAQVILDGYDSNIANLLSDGVEDDTGTD